MTHREVEERAGEAASNGATNVDLSPDFQREIRNLARVLPKLDYYEVLGLTPGASPEEVRDGFFERSKRFHPDRYYKKDLGPYAGLMTEIYKRVLASYDVLRDPELRKTYDDGIGAPPPRPNATDPDAGASTPPPTPKGPSLRDRKGLRPKGTMRGLRDQLDRSRSRAKRQFLSGKEAMDRGEWGPAAKYFRLAMALDPRDKSYQDALADILPRANAARAEELRARADRLSRAGEKKRAAGVYTELCELHPADAPLAFGAAQLCCEIDDYKAALDFAKRAASLDEDKLEYQKLLAQICEQTGMRDQARKAWQRAWEIDPTDEDIKRSLG